MSNHPTNPLPINDVPLPGMVECLTLQVNVTLHRQSGVAKYVAIVRDPNDAGKGEVSRQGASLPWVGLTSVVTAEVVRAIETMIYLCDLPSLQIELRP